ncbi:MAG: LacI family DNA-binding transcriptional regulator [Ancalomicrobiaceae bacterium]|nr:LacI family DNA-binding transcriptional regulator [Ancalomicrobiaceae bacterium]
MSKLTISDIAARAGVSKATVSRVLNDRAEGVGPETRAHVRAILAETGFQPSAMARGLATGHSRSVGLIIPDVINPFHPLLVSGAEQALSAVGYSLFLCNTGSNGAKQGDYIRVLVDKRVDGVILDSVGFEAEAQVRLLEREGIPVVLLDCVIGDRASRYGVVLDNDHGVREAMEFLFRRPDRRLLYIGGPSDMSQSVDRRNSVERIAREWRLAGDQLTVLPGDFGLECGFRLVTELIGKQSGRPFPFNGVFAANDMMALGVLKALRRAGVSVPGEVEVLGYDDIEFARLIDPPLSTVAQPALEMGAASAELLLRLINNDKPRRKTVVMKPRLILRGTTLAPDDVGQTHIQE